MAKKQAATRKSFSRHVTKSRGHKSPRALCKQNENTGVASRQSILLYDTTTSDDASDTCSINSLTTLSSWSNSVASGHGGCQQFESNYEDSISVSEELDNFEADLDTALDQCCNATKKSRRNSTARIKAMEMIHRGFLLGTYNHYFLKRLVTLTDVIQQSLKQKSLKTEVATASALYTSLLCNLADDSDVVKMCSEMIPLLRTLLLDFRLAASIKQNCALALSMTVFLTDCDPIQLEQVLMDLTVILTKYCTVNELKVFNDFEEESRYEYYADDDDVESSVEESSDEEPDPEEDQLVALCVQLAAFLLGCAAEFQFQSLSVKYFDLFVNLLQSDSLSIRIVSGECISLIVERFGDEFLEHYSSNTILTLERQLENLSVGGSKYRCKKDLRKQRSAFRDILYTVQVYCGGGDIGALSAKPGSNVIRFGIERLSLDTWLYEVYYAVFRRALGPALNSHLARNSLLRDIFDLGPVIQIPKDNDNDFDRESKVRTKFERKANLEYTKRTRNANRQLKAAMAAYEGY